MSDQLLSIWSELDRILAAIKLEYAIECRKLAFRKTMFSLRAIGQDRAEAYLIDGAILRQMKAHIDFLGGWTKVTGCKSSLLSGFLFDDFTLGQRELEGAFWQSLFLRHLEAFRKRGFEVEQSFNGGRMSIKVLPSK